MIGKIKLPKETIVSIKLARASSNTGCRSAGQTTPVPGVQAACAEGVETPTAPTKAKRPRKENRPYFRILLI